MAKSAVRWQADIIYHLDDVFYSESQIDRHGSNYTQMMIYRNNLLAVNNDCMQFDIQ